MHHFRPTTAAILLLGLVVAGCTSEPEYETAIDREAFIATYIALRSAMIESDDQTLSPTVRDSILADVGVRSEELLNFADVNGHRLEFMREIWNEIEAELDALRPDPEIR